MSAPRDEIDGAAAGVRGPWWHPASLPFGLAACALAAGWVTLSDFHAAGHADSIVPVLVSLLRWTPMYWDQDRFGMLVPLLTLPLESPFLVILTQVALTTFACFVALVLAARFIVPGAAGTAAGLLGGAVILVLVPLGIRHEMLAPSQPYGVSLALLFGALSLLRGRRTSRRCLAAGLLAILSFWVTIGAAVIGLVITLVLAGTEALKIHRLRPTAGWRDRIAPWIPPAGTLGIALLVLLTVRVFLHKSTVYGAVPVGEYFASWSRWLGELWLATAPHHWPLMAAATALIVVVLWIVPATRRVLLPSAPYLAAVAGAAVFYWLYFGRMRWLAMNDYNFRYAIPSALLLQAALLALLLAPLARLRRASAVLPVLALAALLAACHHRFEWPSVAAARSALDKYGAHTEELLAQRATHFAGDYWVVWPGVFHAHLVAYERGLPLWLYGLTHRAKATRPHWLHPPGGEWRVAAVPGDPTVERWCEDTGIGEVERVEGGEKLELFRPVQPPSAD